MTSVIFGVDAGDANASRLQGHTLRGLKPTAKVSRRYRCEEVIPRLQDDAETGSHVTSVENRPRSPRSSCRNPS